MAGKRKRHHKVVAGRLPASGRYALVPVGMFCNAGLRDAMAGDRVTFYEGWRQTCVAVVRMCMVDVNTAVMTFLTRSIYGERATAGSLMDEWTEQCRAENLGRDAFDRERVLLLEYVPEEDVERTEQEERLLAERRELAGRIMTLDEENAEAERLLGHLGSLDELIYQKRQLLARSRAMVMLDEMEHKDLK